MYQRPFTPDVISELEENEIFVFGSNLSGFHAGGAAAVARDKFGAVLGKGVGLQGNSYAIPTMQGGVETIRPYVDEFIAFAKQHPELTFYVTRIGCGIAGFRDRDIAPLFVDAIDEENILLPREFVEWIEAQERFVKSFDRDADRNANTISWLVEEEAEDEPAAEAESVRAPECLEKFNWGALWAPIIWGLFNRAYLWAVLGFLPIVNYVVAIYLGFKGNKIAWQAFQYEMSPESFDKKQKTWNFLGWVIFVLVSIRLLMLVIDKDYTLLR